MLTKDLINAIAAETGMSKSRCEELLNATVSSIRESLQEGKDVSLQGLGVFEVKNTNERVLVQPRTGEKMVIPAGKKISFRPNNNIKEEIK